MSRRKRRLPTLWEVPDGLWERIQSLLDEGDPPKSRGAPAWIAAVCWMASCSACAPVVNHIPRVYGDDRTIHRYFQRWCALGLLAKIGAWLVEACEELQGVKWEWQAADAALRKARFGGHNWA